ncbi:MAG: glycerophosphodiester phosphodiesterase [Burkholderiaceae bacterium]
MNPPTTKQPWPFPLWIAHRGAGKLAPENTLAAFKLGATYGYRMFECDVKLSEDGTPFLLHDDTLDRTTNGRGTAGVLPWAELSKLDAGSWHSASHAEERIPTLESIAHFCQTHGFWLNIEIKPTPGQESVTGRKVALAARRLWSAQAENNAPLLSSFKPAALAAARDAAPELRRGLLLDQLWDGWQTQANALGCEALICNHRLWTEGLRNEARALGLRALAYTVNDLKETQRLIALQLDGIITDCVDQFKPEQ